MLTAIATTLTACGAKMPECDSPETLSLVKRIFTESMVPTGGLRAEDSARFEWAKKNVPLDLTSIRTTATDESTHKIACRASVDVQLPNSMKEDLRLTALILKVKFNAALASADVEYTAQLTDDKKQQSVEMAGHGPLMETVRDIARTYEARAARVAAQAAQAPLSTATPPPAALPAQVPSAANTSRVERDATLIWMQCEDTCQLQYKDAAGNMQAAYAVRPSNAGNGLMRQKRSKGQSDQKRH